MDGLDVVVDAREVRRRINLIAGGERMVYARLTGRENLWYFGQLYDVPRRGPAAAHRRPAGTGRAGRRRRHAGGALLAGDAAAAVIARGLINGPAYLLLDEPTLGLDAPIARDLRAVVADLARDGVGVLLTSHYLAEVEQLCRTSTSSTAGRWSPRAPGRADRQPAAAHGRVTLADAGAGRCGHAVDALAARRGRAGGHDRTTRGGRG